MEDGWPKSYDGGPGRVGQVARHVLRPFAADVSLFEVVEGISTVDTDGDGLSDEFEALVGSDPTLADTDNDGLSDLEEVSLDGDAGSYRPCQDTDPANPDTDGDGFTDGEEAALGSDPLDSQSPTRRDVGAVPGGPVPSLACRSACAERGPSRGATPSSLRRAPITGRAVGGDGAGVPVPGSRLRVPSWIALPGFPANPAGPWTCLREMSGGRNPSEFQIVTVFPRSGAACNPGT